MRNIYVTVKTDANPEGYPFLLLGADDILKALREACLDYMRTRKGLAYALDNHGKMTIGDAWEKLDPGLCASHGFIKLDKPCVMVYDEAAPVAFTAHAKPGAPIVYDVAAHVATHAPASDVEDFFSACGSPPPSDTSPSAIYGAVIETCREDGHGSAQRSWDVIKDYWYAHCIPGRG